MDVQRTHLEAYCVGNGLGSDLTIYQDEGIAGAIPLDQRPGGKALLDRLAQGEVRHIIALQLDRLFGSARQAYDQLQAWNKARLIVHLVDFNGEPWDTFGERGKTFIGVLVGIAQWERHLIAGRAAIRAENKAHRRAYGPTVYGFQREGKALIPAPSEQAVIGQMRTWRTEGWSFDQIAEELNARGVRTKRGKRWHAPTIRSLLRNDLIQGL